jgi:cytochrome c-type biogenesis protein CcmH
LRLLVRDRLQAGDSNDEVRGYLVARYGDFILLKPPFEMATLLLWVTPIVVIGIGGVLAVTKFRRRVREAQALSATEEESLARILSEKS